MSAKDNFEVINAAKVMSDAAYHLYRLRNKVSRYRFIRGIQLGRGCPGLGKSCVPDKDCICVNVAKDLRF